MTWKVQPSSLTANKAEAPAVKTTNRPLAQGDPLITSAEAIYQSVIRTSDPIAGNQQAKVRLIEFADFQCAYCRQMQSVLAKVISEYQGQVFLVWKDFPNPMHTEAFTAALAARCAQKQDKFWQYHDLLFANQDALSRTLYNKIALQLDLNLMEFNQCLDGRETAALVGDGLTDGQRLGVDATPYLIIGNSIYDYALEEEELRTIIKNKLDQ